MQSTGRRVISLHAPPCILFSERRGNCDNEDASETVHCSRTTGALLRIGDIRSECVFPLAIRDLLDPLPGHLVGA